jgi:hypothetical protein
MTPVREVGLIHSEVVGSGTPCLIAPDGPGLHHHIMWLEEPDGFFPLVAEWLDGNETSFVAGGVGSGDAAEQGQGGADDGERRDDPASYEGVVGGTGRLQGLVELGA